MKTSQRSLPPLASRAVRYDSRSPSLRPRTTRTGFGSRGPPADQNGHVDGGPGKGRGGGQVPHLEQCQLVLQPLAQADGVVLDQDLVGHHQGHPPARPQPADSPLYERHGEIEAAACGLVAGADGRPVAVVTEGRGVWWITGYQVELGCHRKTQSVGHLDAGTRQPLSGLGGHGRIGFVPDQFRLGPPPCRFDQKVAVAAGRIEHARGPPGNGREDLGGQCRRREHLSERHFS